MSTRPPPNTAARGARKSIAGAPPTGGNAMTRRMSLSAQAAVVTALSGNRPKAQSDASKTQDAVAAAAAAVKAASEQREKEMEEQQQQAQQQQQNPNAAAGDDQRSKQPGGKSTSKLQKSDSVGSVAGTAGRVPSSSERQDSDTASQVSSIRPSSAAVAAPASSPTQQQQQIVLRRRFRGTSKLSAQQMQAQQQQSGNQQSTTTLNVQRNVETAFSLVSRSPLFTSLRDHRVLHKIAETVRWMSAAPSQYIVVAGETATEMYFIFSGVVEILLPVSEEEETPIATLSGGDFFGEIALVSKEKTLRTASVQAVRPCELLVLTRQALEEVIVDSDELRECLEREAAKRLQSLRQREQKLLANESEVDRELLRRAALNPLSPTECEWRLLNKARIRGVHRSQPPPTTFQDVMQWARLHVSHTPPHFHGRTTAALATLPDDVTSSSVDGSTTLLLLHPEMGSVYRFSSVIDALAGPDEFEDLCRSFARVLQQHLRSMLQKQALGALALAAHVTLFFSHSRRQERDAFLVQHVNRVVLAIQAVNEFNSRTESSNSFRVSNSSLVGGGSFTNIAMVNNAASSSALPQARGRTGTLTPSSAAAIAAAFSTTTTTATPPKPQHSYPNNYQFGYRMDSIASTGANTTTTSIINQNMSFDRQNSFALTSAAAAAAAQSYGSQPLYIWDSNLLDSMTAQLYRAPCWEVATNINFEAYPKQFVLSDAWAITTLERIVTMREELIKRVCCTALEQMIERQEIVRQRTEDRARLEKLFAQRRLVIRRAISMLVSLEGNHRDILEKDAEAKGAGIFRWHECCMSFVTSQKSAQESALAGQLENATSGGGAGDSEYRRGGGKLSLFARGTGGSGSGSKSHRAHSASASTMSTRRQNVAMLVAQKERMADEAILFQKRVRESRMF